MWNFSFLTWLLNEGDKLLKTKNIENEIAGALNKELVRGRPYRQSLTVSRQNLIAVCLMVFSAALGLFVYLKVASRQNALIAVSQIPAGTVLTADQIKVVQIAPGQGEEFIPASAASSYIGRSVSTTIFSGEIIIPADFKQAASIAPGYVYAGLGLKVGQLPASGLNVGDKVMVIYSPQSNAVSGTGAFGTLNPGEVLVQNATVVEIAPSNQTSSAGNYEEIVSVEIPQYIAGEVVFEASQQNVSLALSSTGATS
jgi:hypothetical protein